MSRKDNKICARAKRIKRIRKKVSGTSDCPRMRVFRSNRHIYVQIIDDRKQTTLVAMSTGDKDFNSEGLKGKCEQAEKVGEMIAERALAAGINNVVFDRGGNLYHGRIKALSDGARKGGLKF